MEDQSVHLSYHDGKEAAICQIIQLIVGHHLSVIVLRIFVSLNLCENVRSVGKIIINSKWNSLIFYRSQRKGTFLDFTVISRLKFGIFGHEMGRNPLTISRAAMYLYHMWTSDAHCVCFVQILIGEAQVCPKCWDGLWHYLSGSAFHLFSYPICWTRLLNIYVTVNVRHFHFKYNLCGSITSVLDLLFIMVERYREMEVWES